MLNTKYIINSADVSPYLNFELSYGSLNLIGQSATFVGSRRADSVYVSEGMSVDFTRSGFGADLIYLTGSWVDYTKTYTDQTLILTRSTASGPEFITVAAIAANSSDDFLVFHDGSIGATAAKVAVQTSVVMPALDTDRVSTAPVIPNLGAVVVKAIAQDNSTTTMGFGAGVHLVIVGGRGVDVVYIKDGSDVDATRLGFGQDLIYLRGSWADYTKVATEQTLSFTRTIGGVQEKVVVAGMPGSGNDQLVFFDGATKSNEARLEFSANPTVALSAIMGYNKSLITPGVDISIQVPTLGLSSNGGIHEDLAITNTREFTVSGLEVFDAVALTSGADHIEYRLDQSIDWATVVVNAVSTTFSFALSDLLVDGLHTVYVREIDIAGNTSAIIHQQILLDTVNSGALSITNENNRRALYLSQAITNSKTFSIAGLENANAEMGISGFNHLEYQLDNQYGQWISAPDAVQSISLGADVVDGAHAIYVREIDHAGNVSSVVNQQFILDTTATTLSISMANADDLANPNHFTKSIAFSVGGVEQSDVAHGVSGFDHFEYRLDSSEVWLSANSGETNLSFSGPILDGMHSISFRQVDAVGNISQSVSNSFVLDTTVATPTISFNADGVSGATFAVSSLEAQDITHGASGFKNLVYQVDESTWVTGAIGATSFTLDGLAKGKHSLNLFEVDLAGNTSAITSLSFTHDPAWSTTSGWGEASVLGAMNLIGGTSYTSSTAPYGTASQLTSMDFSKAWSLGYTGKDIVIADIDTGIDLTNNALMGNITRYQGGSLDWNFINSTADVQDDHGHGSFTAGELVARPSLTPYSNSTGTYFIEGGAYDAQLMVLKTQGADGTGSYSNLVSAIYYAVDHGANVINLSLGFDGYQYDLPELRAAVQYASDHNVVACMSSGNKTYSIPDPPARYASSIECAIAVGASKLTGAVYSSAYFSNLAGADTPYNYINTLGVDIAGFGLHGDAALWKGTSMAAPLIAAEIAVLESMHSGWTAAQIVQAVMLSATPFAGV